MKFDVPSIVIEKLFSNGYEDQIVDIVMACENDSSREVSDIPISPSLLKSSGTNVILSSKIYFEYQKLVEKIANSNTAQEVPFIMVGNKKTN